MEHKFTMKSLQKVITKLSLDNDDTMYNIKMPHSDCEVCGGMGVEKWIGQDSVLCDCLISTDSERESMPFGLLLKLHNIKKDDV